MARPFILSFSHIWRDREINRENQQKKRQNLEQEENIISQVESAQASLSGWAFVCKHILASSLEATLVFVCAAGERKRGRRRCWWTRQFPEQIWVILLFIFIYILLFYCFISYMCGVCRISGWMSVHVDGFLTCFLPRWLVWWVYPSVFNTHAGPGMVQNMYLDAGTGVSVVKIEVRECEFG